MTRPSLLALMTALPVLAAGCAASDYGLTLAPVDPDEAAPVAAEPDPEAERFHVGGAVRDLVSGEPIYGAEVCVLQGAHAVHCVRTEGEGDYRLFPESAPTRGAGPHVVSLEITAPGYADVLISRAAQRSVDSLDVAMPSQLLRRVQESRIGAQSAEGTGHVVVVVEDLAGDPMPGVQVFPWGPSDTVVYTNSLGLFDGEIAATQAEHGAAAIVNARVGIARFAVAPADGSPLECIAVEGVGVEHAAVGVLVKEGAITFARVRCWTDLEIGDAWKV